MQDDSLHVDGNAAAGLLHDIFGREMTANEGACVSCGVTNMVGALTAYVSEVGTVLRCPSCEGVLVRITHIRGRYCVDLRVIFSGSG